VSSYERLERDALFPELNADRVGLIESGGAANRIDGRSREVPELECH
jgi:hypothetical protein